MIEWINIIDELPLSDGYVLGICRDGYWLKCKYVCDNNTWFDYDGCILKNKNMIEKWTNIDEII